MRVAKQWSKEELAERSKTAVRTIYRLESLRSISLPADTTIDALSAALGADTTKWLRLLRAAKVELRRLGGIDNLDDIDEPAPRTPSERQIWAEVQAKLTESGE